MNMFLLLELVRFATSPFFCSEAHYQPTLSLTVSLSVAFHSPSLFCPISRSLSFQSNCPVDCSIVLVTNYRYFTHWFSCPWVSHFGVKEVLNVFVAVLKLYNSSVPGCGDVSSENSGKENHVSEIPQKSCLFVYFLRNIQYNYVHESEAVLLLFLNYRNVKYNKSH